VTLCLLIALAALGSGIAIGWLLLATAGQNDK
jgi:hypothetical protein